MTRGRSFKLWRHYPKRMFLNMPKSLKLVPLISKVFPYTMLSYAGLYQAYTTVEELDEAQVPGDIVEMGCWNGGCGALMASAAKKGKLKRKTLLFDSFEGLPDFSKEDKKTFNLSRGSLKSEVGSVQEILAKLQIAEVSIYKGWFQDTVPKHLPREIALLRLDGDLYESTKYCLEALYDRVAVGGYIIIDDYKNWEGCRRALYEFFYQMNINPRLQFYPYGGVVFFKKEV